MLPKSAMHKQEPLPAKFADTAIPALLEAVREIGGISTRLNAKIAGGANMFANMSTLNIGLKNIEAVKTALETNKIRLIGEEVGGVRGRTVKFNVITGDVSTQQVNGVVCRL
jgi:chemotaxis protein CheD